MRKFLFQDKQLLEFVVETLKDVRSSDHEDTSSEDIEIIKNEIIDL